jgi:hypothetical protein
LFTLDARGEKSHQSLSDKNALTDQYLEEGEPSQVSDGTVLALDGDSKTALDFEGGGKRWIGRLR